YEQDLRDILLEDIVNGRLDDSGPPRDDGQRMGLRLITPEYKPGFIKGPQLLEFLQTDRSLVLHNVVILKEAVLDFAKGRELRPPSWWVDSASAPAEGQNDAKASAIKPHTGAAAFSSVGKQPRILRYLREHFPDGVPDPGACPRHTLKLDILDWDPRLAPLDEATLKKAIDTYNASLSKKSDPN